jgi:hypothetical protein
MFSTLGEPGSYDPTFSPLIELVHDVTNPAASKSAVDLIGLTNASVTSNPTKVTLGPTSHNGSTAFALVEQPVPEPASPMLCASGALGLLAGRRAWRRDPLRRAR